MTDGDGIVVPAVVVTGDERGAVDVEAVDSPGGQTPPPKGGGAVGRPWHRRRTLWASAIFALVLASVVIGLTVGLRGKDEDDGSANNAVGGNDDDGGGKDGNDDSGVGDEGGNANNIGNSNETTSSTTTTAMTTTAATTTAGTTTTTTATTTTTTTAGSGAAELNETQTGESCPPGDDEGQSWPSTGDSCQVDGATCQYGEECCCGSCSHSYECDCDGGTFVCLNTDFCLHPACESSTTTTATTTATTTTTTAATTVLPATTTTEATTTAAATTTVTTTTTTTTTTTGADFDEGEEPMFWQSSSDAPFSVRIQTTNPSIADGYDRCEDLQGNITEAVKHLANHIISEQAANTWYDTWYNFHCKPAEEEEGMESQPEYGGADASADASLTDNSDGGSSSKEEDSYDTNNQVEGVDEADVVKSDGTYVYAAYGDILVVWNATSGVELSRTFMPFNQTDCDEDWWVGPESEPLPMPTVIDEEASEEEADAAGDQGAAAGSSSSLGKPTTADANGGRRRRDSIAYPHPCGQPKPNIQALLLDDDRLAAVVSRYDNNYDYKNQPILSDYGSNEVRLYSTASVPKDGSELELVATRDLQGNYQQARSIESKAYVVSSTHINHWYHFSRYLQRWRPEYCGMNKTEYIAAATAVAANLTDSFATKLTEELNVGEDCSDVFQVSMMQTGDNNTEESPDLTSGVLLNAFVQVTSFNMSADFANGTLSAHVSGAFLQSSWTNVYASQELLVVSGTGYHQDPEDLNWKETTYMLGFRLHTHSVGATPFCVGAVSGRMINQYSMDAYQGHLRVATTVWGTSTNKVFVLRIPQEGDLNPSPIMKQVGVTGNLGAVGEQIFAVRFLRDKGYVVTYERKDPFYILDLSNHTKPEATGELEISGFSNYLHPIGDGNTILAVGQDADMTTGAILGLQISFFDVSDPFTPELLIRYRHDGAFSAAQFDYKAFRYLPESEVLILPVSKWTWGKNDNFDGFMVFDVSPSHIDPFFDVSHATPGGMSWGCWYNAYLRPRSMVFKGKVTTMKGHTVISHDLETGDKEWEHNLDANVTECHGYWW